MAHSRCFCNAWIDKCDIISFLYRQVFFPFFFYGLPRLKTHAKLTLIVHREQNKLKCYLHLGTGNYKPSTGKLYTDYSLFTTNEQLVHSKKR